MNTKPVIELKGGGGYTRWVCDICGDTQEKDGMISRVVFQVDGVHCHYDICRTCLDAGIEGAVKRSHEHAEYLELLAAVHREAVPEVIRSIAEWKSGKDYDAAIKAFEREFMQSLKKIHCLECGTPEGELHEWGCDIELCPFCGGQLSNCLCQKWDEEKNTLVNWDRRPQTDEERAAFEALRLPFVGDGRQLPSGYIPLNWRGEFDPMTGYGEAESDWWKSGAEFLARHNGIERIYTE